MVGAVPLRSRAYCGLRLIDPVYQFFILNLDLSLSFVSEWVFLPELPLHHIQPRIVSLRLNLSPLRFRYVDQSLNKVLVLDLPTVLYKKRLKFLPGSLVNRGMIDGIPVLLLKLRLDGGFCFLDVRVVPGFVLEIDELLGFGY